ncbi:hypothetical protein B5X24_HaOG214964 [Helicoverpa armigera]|nr:hypothetical protein B5X24_HaOG214964 [Helicoverpa armigera]
MSVQRSPPTFTTQLSAPSASSAHYNSDSAINKMTVSESDNNYLNASKRTKRTIDDVVSSPEPSLVNIQLMFADLKSQHDQKYDLLNNALLTIITQNQEIQKSVLNISNNHQELLTKINKLESENLEYKHRLSSLEKQLDFIEKSTRSGTMEVRNLPKQENESKQILTDIIRNISVQVNLEKPIHESEIRDI